MLDLLSDLAVGFGVEFDAATHRLASPHDRHHPGDLLGSHDGDLGGRPQIGETGVEGPSRHAVVAGAVAVAQDDRDVGHHRVRHGVDHLRAVLDDAALLEVLADHVAGDVLQEYQRDVLLVAQLDELGGLLGAVAEQRAVVAQDSHGEAVDGGPAADERGAVAGLELLEAGAVGDAGDDLAAVDERLEIPRHQPEQLLGVMDGRVGRHRRSRTPLAPVEMRHDLPADAQRVRFVFGQVVGEP